jgi:hypothetical protein
MFDHDDNPIQITIHVDADGNFRYDNAVQIVRKNQRVQWISPNGDFAICFGERSPFDDEFEVRGRKGTAAPEDEDRRGLKPSGDALGTYKYAVAVCTEQGVFIDAGCPHIKVP